MTHHNPAATANTPSRRIMLAGGLATLSVAALSAAIAQPADAAITRPAAAGAASHPHWTGRIASFDHSVTLRSGPGFNYHIVGYAAANSVVSGYVYNNWTWLHTSRGYLHMDTALPYFQNTSRTNGYMSTSAMAKMPTWLNSSWSGAPGYTPATQRYLKGGALSQLMALNAAYHQQFGRNVSIDLAYRSMSEQQYWYHLLGYPNAAIPGSSNHGFGLAVDFWENNASPFRFGQSGYNWLIAHGNAFGWTQPAFMRQGAYNPEYWHFNFTG